MLEIKLLYKSNALGDRVFYNVEDAVTYLVVPPWKCRYISDVVLIVNGRRYEWPGGNFLIRNHIQYCVDMDEAFYD